MRNLGSQMLILAPVVGNQIAEFFQNPHDGVEQDAKDNKRQAENLAESIRCGKSCQLGDDLSKKQDNQGGQGNLNRDYRGSAVTMLFNYLNGDQSSKRGNRHVYESIAQKQGYE